MNPNGDAANHSDEQFRRARDEMDRRLRAGESCGAESFLEAYPSLAADTNRAVELICTEYAIRRELGQHPSPVDWLARFPSWRAALQQRLDSDPLLRDGEVLDASTAAEETAPLFKELPRRVEVHGRKFDRYTLLEEVGRGGMGVVYKAHDPRLDRTIALKVVRGGLLGREEEIQRFYREARAAARLEHDHIVRIHDVGCHEEQPYYTMAFIEGSNLARSRGRFEADPRAAVALVETLARAVHHAHEKGIVHRDLKPSNILLDQEGKPKVGDFGLAKVLDDPELTRTGQVLGTPAYMAPEQAQGRASYAGPPCDVWALGVLLYELLTGRRPFEAKSTQQLAHKIVTADPPGPRTLRANLDSGLETMILACLEKDPARRYGSAAALADDLGRWQRGETISRQPASQFRRSWRAIRRRRHLVSWICLGGAVSAGILFVALALGGAFTSSKGTPPNQSGAGDFSPQTDLAAKGHWAVGKGEATTLDGGFRLEANELALWEIPWEHLADRFRIQVEVEDLAPNTTGVGVYFGFAELKTAEGTEHWFYEYSFAEHPPAMPGPDTPPGQAQAQVLARRHATGLRGVGTIDHSMAPSLDRYTLDFFPERGASRLLTVDFTPDLVSAYWQQVRGPFALIPANQFKLHQTSMAAQEPRRKNAPPLFHPLRGGLGLFCEKGSALFRRLTIEPLPGNK